ncbi:MAG: amino-acid N-acetyltransferase [Gammaproteobacteria bacterium]|jgi:amino-acid N-acetyltransferase|nr:amino-acid N-acetyltransferase [Gammaproteobacteria bacterium]MBT3860424.1 amino-acid N-acetyltransferase [Gammaproteobacteria bacterium]MBT3988695.1 amino-acid N-acetyltransferase [Gammaproteobacteria bacterium]MBT4255298.1 amino-acid N-acetyltransferase [Gammaproteobacteria bacterium]MBT4581417.1 amino-acid N-acetyltransferase [Gammaproteobacteria bacterium]
MNENNTEIINWFRASTSYINAHRNKTFVVLLAGEALADNNLPNVVSDLTLLHSLGVKLVLVHGARPQISAALEKNGRKSKYHKNLRITEAECMDTVMGAVGAESSKLEALLSMGASNSSSHGIQPGLCRGNFVTAKPVGVHDGIDYQYTGNVRKIRVDAIEQQLDQNNIVLLSNLAFSLTGEVFNLTAEEIATEAAIALNAEKFILLVPEPGVIDDNGELVLSLSESDAASYAKKLSKLDEDAVCISHALEACIRAYNNGVHRSHLVSFKENGALIRELFTREGNGSLISSDNFDNLRGANIEDVSGILNLIKPLEENGTLVERSRELLETEIENFKIVELEESIIACAALYDHGDGFGEVACIAIDSQFQKNGYGDRLLASLETEAKNNGIDKLFVLTTVTAHWFLEKGFVESKISELPQQRQQLYNFQRKSKVLTKTI